MGGAGGDGRRVPQNFVRRGLPCNCSPRFHSTIVVGISLGRYKAIEYCATFDDTRPVTSSSKLYMKSFDDHDLLEKWLRNVIDLCYMLCKKFLQAATMETHSILNK
jgi:hypothetical protein